MSKERRYLKKAWKDIEKEKKEFRERELEQLFYIFNEVNRHKDGEDK